MELLDLHYVKEDPDLGIAPEGVLCKNMNDIIARISKVKDTVDVINLDNQPALKEVPSVLKECKRLKTLNISHTGITDIPDFLSSLPNLTNLSCRCSEISNFPIGIFKSEKFESLYLRINKNWKIPGKIPVIQNLKTLFFDIYSSAALPGNLGDFKNLEELSLAIKYEEGDVPELPDSFNGHPSLKGVNITDPFYRKRKTFNLDNAAKILSSCKNFESLKLLGLAVEKGHQRLSMLSGLKKLELRHLLAEGNIFDSIAGLQHLETLNIWGSEFKLAEIPDIFTNMKEMREFTFAGNLVQDIPPSIYSLENLKILEIGSTGISEIDERIGDLKNLEKIQLYDNILDKLPDSIFTLPSLKILNIEENIFNANTITAIKEKLSALANKGQKILFMYDGQGHRQMVKKLRAIKNIESMNIETYVKYCLNAVNENPNSIKYVNTDKLNGGKFYAELSLAAVKQTCLALKSIKPEIIGKPYYFHICMEAAGCPNIAKNFKLIRGDLLTDNEYIQVCLEAALHNRSADFLANFNNEAFNRRFGRNVYEHICWVTVLHNPQTILSMAEPPEELLNLITAQSKK
jgi:Leucine-rich repeat (LRR) protein